MIKYVYLAIVAFLIALIATCMFKKKNNTFFQFDVALVLVTLILRLLLIK